MLKLHGFAVKSQPGILILDTDAANRRALHSTLLTGGFEITDAAHTEEAIALSRVLDFDIVLLNMPSQCPGVKTCRALRVGIPLSVLIVLNQTADPERTAEILDAGADQCFSGRLPAPELLARLRATLRPLWNPQGAQRTITIGEVTLEPGRRQVFRGGMPVHLTPKEFELLHYLMIHAGTPISHASLLKAGWRTDDFGRVEYLRIFVRQLRMKLNDQPDPKYILTDNCIGYRFAEPESFLPGVHAAAGMGASALL